MKIQALAFAFLAAAAIGGLAWVFLYPLLSGEKKAAEPPRLGRATGTGRASGRQEPSARAANRSKDR